jgi:SecD/SecF fusion protein
VLFSQDEPPVPYLVEDRVIVSGDNFVSVNATVSYANEPVVSFSFDSKGKARFAEATSQNVGKPFAIILDYQVLSAPVIREPILGGTGQISGNFTMESAKELALILRSGPMGAKMKIVEVRTIAPGGVQN